MMTANKSGTYADLVVIGGGPAGMMCAAEAASRGLHVVLLEPNRSLGRKLRITGKGRCNLTNNCDVRTVMNNIPGDGRFLYSALNKLPPSSVIAFFEAEGLALKTERGNRVFPVSDNANDVADTMERVCRRRGVELLHTAAKDIRVEDAAVAAVLTSEGEIPCGAAALCTGGLSYPLTGSTGFGLRMAAKLGHTLTPTLPSLVPLESGDWSCSASR